MGFMSPQFNALTTSQDLIGWRDFTEGYVSIFQHTSTRFRRSISQCRVVISMGRIGPNNSSPRISNLLIHSGFSGTYPFMTKKNGYLRNKMANELPQHINSLSDLAPEDLPESSRFLLEINFSKLTKYHLETKSIGHWRWMLLSRPMHLNTHKDNEPNGSRRHSALSRKKLGIAFIEHQICQDGMHAEVPPDILWTTDCHQLSLDRFIKWHPHPASIIACLSWSNKKLRKPD